MTTYCPFCGNDLTWYQVPYFDTGDHDDDVGVCDDCEAAFMWCEVCDGTGAVNCDSADDIPFDIDCPECEGRGFVEIAQS